MKIRILGGGPAGLYFALLMKRDWPTHDVVVHERNRLDDTFGFGVVFSDETLETLAAADAETHAAIVRQFATWDDIEIRFKGTRHRIGGNGFCGCARQTLLTLLQDRCRALGVTMRFQSSFEDLAPFADADLIVAADGINSAIREHHADHFRPSVDLRPNRFAWMGSTRPLDAFTFSFRETPWGIVIAHAYQYEPGRSTWIFETDAESFARAGLDGLSETESAALMADLFAEDLDGHGLLTNRSVWRNFPMIRNARWTMGNVVLLGDAKSSAHFSIGSGTKLAMEDAISLHASFRLHAGDVSAALAHFEAARRLDVEKTQHAADVSLVWFEHVRRFWHMHPTQFAFGVMTRSRAITYDNLRLRAPDFVEAADRVFAAQAGSNAEAPPPPMFQPISLRDMRVNNRVVVSPMCMYSARDGTVDDWHLVHYGTRAIGGAGLIFTEMTCVTPTGRITPGCAGLYSDENEEAWARIVRFVRANSEARFCLQLGHSGRKGATKLMWEGMDQPLEAGAWETVAPSALPYFPYSVVPREIDRAEMDRIRDAFVAAAQRGLRIGFDMLELHAAHGYLLASFISPLTNHRTDDYGGSLENRLRYPLEVFDALRAVWPQDQPMSVRISATDWKEGGITGEDSVLIARAFAAHGCDLIDVSTGQTVHDSEPVYGRMFQTPYSEQIRNEAGLRTMCVGNITTADQVNTILAAGRADLVALGRPHLTDPYFAMRAAAQYGLAQDGEAAQPCPVQYQPGREQLGRTMAQQMADLRELRLKVRPRKQGAAWRQAGG
jgi:anthraniloyl-CoA monooxygenase